MNYNSAFIVLKNKYIIITLFLGVTLNTFAQSGTYIREPKILDGTMMKWTLSLDSDGTFLYHFYRNIVGEVNPKENYYGIGTWVLEGKSIVFFSNKTDDIYSVNLNHSKARYIIKSTRDKSDKIVKTSIRFYESEAFVNKGLELFKE